MAVKCRLSCEVVRSRRPGCSLIRPRWDIVTRGCDRGAVIEELGHYQHAPWPCNKRDPFGTHKVLALSEKKWLWTLGVSEVHTIDARFDKDNTDNLELLHSRDCSRGTLRGSEGDWEKKSASSEVRGDASRGTGSSSCNSTWWSIGDSIHEVLNLPNNFEKQVEMLFEKLECRLASQELLLRVLAHRSYYKANMPVAIRDLKKVIDSAPSSEGASEIPFSECHRQARANLARVGDALLNVVTGRTLILEHPFQPTGGEITQRRAQLVCNSNLSQVWSSLGFDDLPLTHPFQSMSKAKDIHADTFEALIGAVDNEKGSKFAEDLVATKILPLFKCLQARNPISLLQEQSLTALQIIPEYRVIGIDNKDTPLQVVRVRVYVKGARMATGLGSSSKTARQDAADKAMRKWPQRFEQLSKLQYGSGS